MERYGLTTPVAARMLRVGERSGNMGEMMERIAAFYDEELSRGSTSVTRLIEPALMSLIGMVDRRDRRADVLPDLRAGGKLQ